jgi:hypothetical protein
VGNLVCFRSLVIVNNAAISMDAQVFCSNLIYIPLGISPGLLLLDYMAVLFLVFLRSLHSVFHRGCSNLHSHEQNMGVPSSPHSRQHLLLFVLLMKAILTWCWFVFPLWLEILSISKAACFFSYVEYRPNTNISYYVYIEIYIKHISQSGTGRGDKGKRKSRKER